MQMIVSLVYDEEYRGYVADVPGLSDCMSQGKTVETVLKNVREAIRLYMETNPEERRAAPRHVLIAATEVPP